MGLMRKSGIVGLELDTGVIRGVEVKGRPGAASVVRVGQVAIPEPAMAEGMIVDLEAVKVGISRLWRTSRFSTRDVVLGVANQGVLMRLARFPRVPDRRLDAAIRYQAGEYFPIPMSQLVLDFQVVGMIESDVGDEMDVLLVAARRDMIQKKLGAAMDAGLRVRVVDTCALSLMRTVSQDKLAGNVALVNIANGLTNVLVVSEQVPRLGRLMQSSLSDCAREADTDIAGLLADLSRSQLAAAPAKQGLSVDELKARARRRRTMRKKQVEAGMPARTLKDRALSDWAVAMSSEIQSTITYSSSHDRGEGVTEVIVSGTGARLPGVVEALGRELGIPARPSRLANHVRWPGKNQPGVNLDATEYAVCVGLALRGLEE